MKNATKKPVVATPIGVEIRGRWMKAAQLSPSGWRTLRVQREFVPGPKGWCPSRESVALFAEALHDAGFDGPRVVLGAPTQVLLSQTMELPPRSSGAPIETLATAELARASRVDAGSIEVAVWDTPGGGRSAATSVIAMGLEHSTAAELMEPFASTELQVVAIDASPVALGRLPQACAAGAHAFVDLGWDDTVFSIVLDGLPIYQRRLGECGLAVAYSDIMARDEVGRPVIDAVLMPSRDGDAERDAARALLLARWRSSVSRVIDPLASELERSLAYAGHRYPRTPVQTVNVCGEGGVLPGLIDRLQASLKALPVSTMDESALAVARGLALWTNRLVERGQSQEEAA